MYERIIKINNFAKIRSMSMNTNIESSYRKQHMTMPMPMPKNKPTNIWLFFYFYVYNNFMRPAAVINLPPTLYPTRSAYNISNCFISQRSSILL